MTTNSFEYRKDFRTKEIFEENLIDFTEREYYWGIILRLDFTERGHPCSLIEHGVDNTGKLIEGRLPNYNVDKIFSFLNGKKKPVEIKSIPENINNFMTFKVSSLEVCCEEDAWLIVPRSKAYYLYNSKTCRYLLENYPHKIYWNYETQKGFSPKPAVRIFKNDIQKFIKDNKITEV